MTTRAEREDRLLRLQRLESKLVDGLFDHPGVVSRRDEHRLRYALSLAALDTFQPGAARRGRRNDREDVKVRSPRLGGWRRHVLDAAERPMLGSDGRATVEAAMSALAPAFPRMAAAREQVLEKYVDAFSARELDQELGIKSLVTVAGGGGGAGYVYLGAWDVLTKAGLVPSYIVGASMGALLGLFRAFRRKTDLDEQLALAKNIRPEDVFSFGSLKRRYGMPGVMRLFLHEALGGALAEDETHPVRLRDLEIPFDTVVAGIRRGAMETPEEYAQTHHLAENERPGRLELRAQIAVQLVRLVGFINPKVVREVLIGADDLTRDCNAIDAVGFSSSIPGILHYDVTHDDARTHEIFNELMEREEVTALVDGGVANNVPARTAWRQVWDGRIGTRNAYVLAFDSFHPQWRPAHVWLQPVTRLVALQVALGDRYSHRRIEFRPTLSPLNLLPPPRDLDRAARWGRRQMAAELPRLQKYFERVRWVPPGS